MESFYLLARPTVPEPAQQATAWPLHLPRREPLGRPPLRRLPPPPHRGALRPAGRGALRLLPSSRCSPTPPTAPSSSKSTWTRRINP
ncbi:hypothetical protein ABZP36_020626 [Zizania latifolia]